jgi:hypothetical protein
MILVIAIAWTIMGVLALWLWARKFCELKAWDVPLVIIAAPIVLMIMGCIWLDNNNPVIWRKK